MVFDNFSEKGGDDMLPNIGFPELIIVLFILLLLFGANRITGIGSSLGKALRGFYDEVSGKASEKKRGE